MKIEIGESLLVSWLKHVKECHLVQTNWKVSSMWDLKNKDELESLMSFSSSFCSKNFGYDIYKKTSSLDQLLSQAEIDILGVNFSETSNNIYAIDIAFHEAGLNYGSRDETVARVIKKIIRTVMCIRGYFVSDNVQIIFASPKINPAVKNDLEKSIGSINELFVHSNIKYDIKIIANEDFNDKILSPVLNVIGNVADTSELFMRSLQLYNMFAKEPSRSKGDARNTYQKITPKSPEIIQAQGITGLEEMKVGAIAKTILRTMLENGKISASELESLQLVEYSKKIFDIQYPLLLLTKAKNSKRPMHYYANPLKIYGQYYFLCCEWHEADRPYLLKWLSEHDK